MEQRKIPAPYSACRPGSLRLEENLHFSLSAAGGTPVPSLPTVPNLKWWVICYGPKGSRKAWPNLTKPEGHKKDFEQNVSGLLALPIPSQLLRANNFHVMAVGERRGEKSEKSFWWKTASFGEKKKKKGKWIPQCLHKHSVCLAALGSRTGLAADPGHSRLWAGVFAHLTPILCSLPWRGSSPQCQSPRISASSSGQTSLS